LDQLLADFLPRGAQRGCGVRDGR